MKHFRSTLAAITATILFSMSFLPSTGTAFSEEGITPKEMETKMELHHEKPLQINEADPFQVQIDSTNTDAVTLFYRTSEFSQSIALQMEESEDGLFSAIIPQTALWSSQIEYWFESINEDEEKQSSSYQVNIERKTNNNYNTIPKLLITEANLVNDGYQFIELYNNTNQTIDLDNYQISIVEQDITLPFTDDTTIKSQETKVVWLINEKDNNRNATDFNNQYGSNLKDDQLIGIEDNQSLAGDSTIMISEKNTGLPEVIVPYQQVEANSSHLFYYPEEGNEMNDGGFSINVQPGSLVAGQVPEETTLIEASISDTNEDEIQSDPITEDNKDIVQNDQLQQEDIIHDPVNKIDMEKALTLEATVSNANKVTLQYQTGEFMELQELDLIKQDDNERYIVEVPKNQLWSPLFKYKIIVEYKDGNTSTFPEIGYVEAELFSNKQIDTQQIPPLLITEITPDTTNINKLDGYEFIEIYNNTNQPINIKDYKIIYRYPAGSSSPDQHWNLTEDKIIDAQDNFIVWIHNDENKDKTIADFNQLYGLNLTESNVTIIESDGMANGTERTLVIADNFNNEIVQATYNDGQKNVKADKGIIYKYPAQGTSMEKVGVSETITPLTIIPGQVPSVPVQVEIGHENPVIEHKQPTLEEDQAITLEVTVTSEQDVSGVNAYVRQSNSMDFQAIPMNTTENPEIYTITIPREMIWSDQISYYFEASNQSGTERTETYELYIPQPEVDYQQIPPLFITELVPDSTNVNTLDGYEFIEVYNNADQAIDFNDYTIRYRYPMEGPGADLFWGPSDEEEVIIPSGETVVFWIINSGNTHLTEQDFNSNYGTSLQEGTQLIKIYNNGMSNSALRSLVIATKTGHELSTVSYYDEVNVDDTIADKGIFYRFPTDGSKQLTKISAGILDATPGSVMTEQVPVEKVKLKADNEKPMIKDLTESKEVSSTEPVQVIAEMKDNIQVKLATLHYRTLETEDFKKVNLVMKGNNLYQHTLYQPELIGKKAIEYYFTASDGVNKITSETTSISIHHPGVKEGLRLNVSDEELISGEKTIKATSEQSPDKLKLFIDEQQQTDTFTALETEAYFAFDVRKTNLFFQNGVTMGEDILHIFDDTINEYTTLTVPIQANKLEHGDNTISIRSGNKVSPFEEGSSENRDDFNVKNVRLVLTDGTTIYDPNYSNINQELSVGDNGSSIPVFDFTFTIDQEKFTSLAYQLDTTGLSDGYHEIKAVLDKEEVKTKVIIDNTEPTIQPTIEEGKSYKGKFTIDAEIDDATSEVDEITTQLDGKYISLPYETSSALLDPGAHELIITAIDLAGNKGTKKISFSTIEERPLLPEWLSNHPADTSASLSVRVSDPTNDSLDVSFYQSYQYTATDTENMKISHNAVDTEPPQSYLPEGEKNFSQNDIEQLKKLDGQEFGTESTTQFPYHRFDVTVDDQVKSDDEIEIVWNGSSLPGRKVTMYAWNYETEKWQDLVNTIAGEESFQLIGSVTGNEYIQNQKVSVIVQDQIEEKLDDDFTFIWMSDTQYYSQSYPHIYEQQVDWIAAQQEALNIQYVFHTGDLVDDSEDFNQWDVADRSMKVLDDANIPYGVLAGNHDVDHKDGLYDNYYQFFSEDRFKDRPYYGESYLNNRGHYDLISANGNDFIMIYMGWGVDEEGIKWMNEILEKYPNRKAFINLHEYLLASGTRSPIGEEVFQKVVVPNPNVYAVLAGHYHNSQKVIDEIDDNNDGIADRSVYQLLANYQGGPEGGEGYLRLLNFNFETNEIDVQTYSPYLDEYNYYDPIVHPGKDEFKIPWDMTPQVKKVATDYVEINVYTNNIIGKVDNVPSGEIASVLWNDLDPNGKYFWHVIAADHYGAEKRSNIWSFNTKEGVVIEPEPEEPLDPKDPEDPLIPKDPLDSEDEDGPVIKDPTVNQPDTNDEENKNIIPNNNNNQNNKQDKEISPLFENTTNVNKGGVPLPSTATNIFNYLIAGLLLLVTGGCTLLYRKKGIRIE